MEENICRLCFNLVKSEFEVIDAVARQMLQVVLMNMDLNASKDPIICVDCAEILKKSYFFKSACVDTEEIILSFSTTKEGAKFDMKDVYRDSKGVQTVVDEKLNICRLCMNEIGSNSCVSLDKLLKDVMYVEMLQVFMPQMDFNVIKDPLICTSCWENLECYFKFTRNCSDTEEKINKYRQCQPTKSMGQIKLSNVLGFLSKGTLYPDNCTQVSITKQDGPLGEVKVEVSEETVKYEAGAIKKEQVDSQNSCEDTKNEMYKCAKCSYESKYKRYLTRHMLKHMDVSEVKMYKCEICIYETKYKDDLKIHMLKHKKASEVKMHKCELCTYETKYKKLLKSHRLCHKDPSEIKMYKCEICTYETKYPRHLKSHMLKHKDTSEVQMIKCELCSYETKYKDYLKKHMAIHRDTSEVEMHKCLVCGFETKYQRHLKWHTLRHKDSSEVEMYKCEVCTYETKYKDGLRRHMVIHKDSSEIEMHKCLLCSYEAKRKQALKRHMLRHRTLNFVI